jgi:hypothetical protein
MSEGSDRKPPDGKPEDEKQKFDDVWDALVDRASDSQSSSATGDHAPTRDGARDATEPPQTSERTREPNRSGGDLVEASDPPAQTAATKLWDDAARVEGLRAVSETTLEKSEKPEATAATKPWDDAARAVAKPSRDDGPTAARSADDMKMDALMAEAELVKRARLQASRRELDEPKVPEPVKTGAPVRTPWLERSDEKMKRIMKESLLDSDERDGSGAAGGGNPKRKPHGKTASTENETGSARSPEDTKRGEAKPNRVAGKRETRERETKRAEPGSKKLAQDSRPPAAPPEAGAGRGRVWILLIGIFALFGLWALLPERTDRPVVPSLDADRPGVPVGPAAEHPGGPPRPGPVSPDSSPAIERPPHDPEPVEPVEPVEPEPVEPEPEPEPVESDEVPTVEPRVDGSDLRTPPPGTAPEHAEAFRKLPVGPGDGPPVGRVGEGGIHIDHIALGSTYGRGGCDGKLDDFSVSERDRVNVCLRVIHPREKEEVVVLWQKDGDTIRRAKLSIVPQHAYRTRAYLMLRAPYVGRWAVRIFSVGGVELASHEFQVVQ